MKIQYRNSSKIFLKTSIIAVSLISILLIGFYIYLKNNQKLKSEIKSYYNDLKIQIAKSIGPNYDNELIELEKSISRSSKIIKNQARIIDYLQNNPMKFNVENNCVNQNFHLKNSDFGYSDLHTEKMFTISKDFIYKENLYLQYIKFLDVNHSGISNIENFEDKFVLKLENEIDYPKAIDLIGNFKKDNGSICQIPIRVFFFGKRIISQKNELLKLYKNVSFKV